MNVVVSLVIRSEAISARDMENILGLKAKEAVVRGDLTGLDVPERHPLHIAIFHAPRSAVETAEEMVEKWLDLLEKQQDAVWNILENSVFTMSCTFLVSQDRAQEMGAIHLSHDLCIRMAKYPMECVISIEPEIGTAGSGETLLKRDNVSR